MKKIVLYIVVALALALWGTDRASGQKLSLQADGCWLLDCSAASKMPQNMVTTQKKYTGTYTATQTEWLDGAGKGALAIQEDKKIYYKLEITNGNLTNTGTIGPQKHGHTWDYAFNKCKALTYASKTGWRLPTRRELAMILLFRDAFASAGSVPLDETTYWSATEVISTVAYGLGSQVKFFVQARKQDAAYARCVREV